MLTLVLGDYKGGYCKASTPDKSEILPGLFIGNWRSSLNDDFLNHTETGAIICVNFERTHDDEYIQELKAKGIAFADFRVDDDSDLWRPSSKAPKTESKEKRQDYVADVFERSYSLISKTLRQKKKVLVHCTAGMNRSATIVANYMVRTRIKMASDDVEKIEAQSRQGLRDEVLQSINLKRDVVWPSTAMKKHLLAAIDEYIAERSEVLQWAKQNRGLLPVS
ncbi:Dual specificity protein phosphatase [uncultured virus]|nr:Dual specificity protein phosphatase [uncultured virus]